MKYLLRGWRKKYIKEAPDLLLAKIYAEELSINRMIFVIDKDEKEIIYCYENGVISNSGKKKFIEFTGW